MNSVISVSGIQLQFNGQNGHKNQNGKACPISFDNGKRLFQKTVGNHVYPKYWKLIKGKQFYFCPNADCPVIYFNNEEGLYFSQDELRAPVMHKMPIGTEGRPVCYCMQVMESEVLEEILVKKCCDSLIDIQEYTGANKGKDCKITNPTGRCCGTQLRELLLWIKEHKEELVEVPLMEEATSCCVSIEENTKNMPIELEDNILEKTK